MTIAIMQPYVFPYIGYFQLINSVDKFVLLDDVHYINKGWINRNRILMNGKIVDLTIPLKKASQNKLIKDTNISYDYNWQHKILKTIEVSYKKAPFFASVFPMISEVVLSNELYISEFAHNALVNILTHINVNTPIVNSSIVYNNTHLKAQDRIIDICQQEHANQYINPIGGFELYQKEAFEKKGIKLKFIKPNLSEYKQLSPSYVAGLSIIDVLMYNSIVQIREFLQDCQFE